jgi:hypothetical protein
MRRGASRRFLTGGRPTGVSYPATDRRERRRGSRRPSRQGCHGCLRGLRALRLPTVLPTRRSRRCTSMMLRLCVMRRCAVVVCRCAALARARRPVVARRAARRVAPTLRLGATLVRALALVCALARAFGAPLSVVRAVWPRPRSVRTRATARPVPPTVSTGARPGHQRRERNSRAETDSDDKRPAKTITASHPA